MPRKKPVSFFTHKQHFLEHPQPRRIMFCKRFKVLDMWDIFPGAILDLDVAFPGLVKKCQKLYKEDNLWFIGDTDALMNYKF